MNFLDSQTATEQQAEINITPLIDVVFLLLIFFMVTTTFSENHGIKVDLPSSSAKNNTNKKTSFVLTLDKEGKVFLNEAAIAPDKLQPELSKFHQQNPEATLVLRADKLTKHQDVVTVMDAAKRADITNLGIATSFTAEK